MKKSVAIYRLPGWGFRWEARTTDSRGAPMNGVGMTKRGAISHLRRRLAAREQWIAPRPKELDEVREVEL